MKRVGSRQEVYEGKASRTSGCLTKKDLIRRGDKYLTNREAAIADRKAKTKRKEKRKSMTQKERKKDKKKSRKAKTQVKEKTASEDAARARKVDFEMQAKDLKRIEDRFNKLKIKQGKAVRARKPAIRRLFESAYDQYGFLSDKLAIDILKEVYKFSEMRINEWMPWIQDTIVKIYEKKRKEYLAKGYSGKQISQRQRRGQHSYHSKGKPYKPPGDKPPKKKKKKPVLKIPKPVVELPPGEKSPTPILPLPIDDPPPPFMRIPPPVVTLPPGEKSPTPILPLPLSPPPPPKKKKKKKSVRWKTPLREPSPVPLLQTSKWVPILAKLHNEEQGILSQSDLFEELSEHGVTREQFQANKPMIMRTYNTMIQPKKPGPGPDMLLVRMVLEKLAEIHGKKLSSKMIKNELRRLQGYSKKWWDSNKKEILAMGKEILRSKPQLKPITDFIPPAPFPKQPKPPKLRRVPRRKHKKKRFQKVKQVSVPRSLILTPEQKRQGYHIKEMLNGDVVVLDRNKNVVYRKTAPFQKKKSTKPKVKKEPKVKFKKIPKSKPSGPRWPQPKKKIQRIVTPEHKKLQEELNRLLKKQYDEGSTFGLTKQIDKLLEALKKFD